MAEIRFYEVREGWRGPRGERLPRPEAEGLPVEVLGPTVAGDTALAAVSLDLPLAPPWPRLARFILTEEAERSRELFSVDAQVQGEGALRVTLDWPDYVLRAGGRLVAILIFDEPTRIAAGSSLVLHSTSLEEAREEYVARQLGWFAPWYSYHAEAHVWDSANWDPSSMPELRWLENVRHVDPDHPLAAAYDHRIFHHTREVEVTIPSPPEAPLWARAEREAMRRTAEVVHWWIDQRQTEDGQFGGGWNDDVEMLHGWDLLVLGAGDEKVRESTPALQVLPVPGAADPARPGNRFRRAGQRQDRQDRALRHLVQRPRARPAVVPRMGRTPTRMTPWTRPGSCGESTSTAPPGSL